MNDKMQSLKANQVLSLIDLLPKSKPVREPGFKLDLLPSLIDESVEEVGEGTTTDDYSIEADVVRDDEVGKSCYGSGALQIEYEGYGQYEGK
ncbi:hypothetical protein Tco_0204921 [Tanacetum coccineum]